MTTSPRERLWQIGGTIVGLLLVLVAYFMFIAPQNNQTTDKNSQVDAVRARNDALQNKIDRLRTQNTDLATYQQQLKQARLALPDTSGLPDFLRTLQSLGNATLTDVTGLTVGAPTDVTVVGGGTGSTKPALGSTRVYALPITAQVSGSRGHLSQFLTQLQSVQPRAVLISQITEGPTGANGKGELNLQLTMQAFVAPANPDEQATLAAASH
jgi:Tfp pilus assembly protein PilO